MIAAATAGWLSTNAMASSINDPADQDRVRRLLADKALQVPVARRPLRGHDRRGREGGRAEVADLAPWWTRSVSAPSVSSMSMS
jgi:hypothetical protein